MLLLRHAAEVELPPGFASWFCLKVPLLLVALAAKTVEAMEGQEAVMLDKLVVDNLPWLP